MIVQAKTDAFGFLGAGATITVLQNNTPNNIYVVWNGEPGQVRADDGGALIEVSPSRPANFSITQENTGDVAIPPHGTLSIGKAETAGLYSLEAIMSVGDDSFEDIYLLNLFNQLAESDRDYTMNSMLLAALGLTSAASIASGAVIKVGSFTEDAKSELQAAGSARTVNNI